MKILWIPHREIMFYFHYNNKKHKTDKIYFADNDQTHIYAEGWGVGDLFEFKLEDKNNNKNDIFKRDSILHCIAHKNLLSLPY